MVFKCTWIDHPPRQIWHSSMVQDFHLSSMKRWPVFMSELRAREYQKTHKVCYMFAQSVTLCALLMKEVDLVSMSVSLHTLHEFWMHFEHTVHTIHTSSTPGPLSLLDRPAWQPWYCSVEWRPLRTSPLAQTARRHGVQVIQAVARASQKGIHGHILACHGGITAHEEGHYLDRLPAAHCLRFGVRKLIPTIFEQVHSPGSSGRLGCRLPPNVTRTLLGTSWK